MYWEYCGYVSSFSFKVDNHPLIFMRFPCGYVFTISNVRRGLSVLNVIEQERLNENFLSNERMRLDKNTTSGTKMPITRVRCVRSKEKPAQANRE